MVVHELLKLWEIEDEVTCAINTNRLIQNKENWQQILGKLYGLEVKENTRLVTCAGKAHYRPDRFISLHPALFDKYDYVAEDRVTVFLHELAHQIANLTTDEKGHGINWIYCMIHFGLEPNVYYNSRIWNYRNYKERKIDRTVNALEQYGFSLGKET